MPSADHDEAVGLGGLDERLRGVAGPVDVPDLDIGVGRGQPRDGLGDRQLLLVRRAVLVAAAEVIPLEEVERRYILRVLDLARGQRGKAAELLGIDRKTLYRKLAAWGIDADREPPPAPARALQSRSRMSADTLALDRASLHAAYGAGTLRPARSDSW